MGNWRVFLDSINDSPDLCSHADFLKKNIRLLKGQEEDTYVQEPRTLGKSLDALIQEAAEIRLDALHREVEKIQANIDPEGWKSLCVVVMGPHMPREGELSVQYFETLLKTKACAKKCPYATALANVDRAQKVIYAESIHDEEKALDLITTYLCDGAVGRSFLNNDMRGDVLQHATRKWLKNIEDKLWC